MERRQFLKRLSSIAIVPVIRSTSVSDHEVPEKEIGTPHQDAETQPATEPEIYTPVVLSCREVASWIGKASYYSETGCGGCSPSRIMANGQRFNENAYTIAFMRLPLNTPVRVTNLDNDSSVIASVTDRGGFESHGRIADLSLAVARTIRLQTDRSLIQITQLAECP